MEKTYVTSLFISARRTAVDKVARSRDSLPEMEKKNIAKLSPAHLVLLIRSASFRLIRPEERGHTNYERFAEPDCRGIKPPTCTPAVGFSILILLLGLYLGVRGW